MSYGKLTYSFIASVALGYSAAVQAAWPHDGEKINAFGGELTLVGPAGNIRDMHKEDIHDTRDLDAQIRCTIKATMKEKAPEETLIATYTADSRWAANIYSRNSDAPNRIISTFEDGILKIWNLSSYPMVVSEFNDDLSPKRIVRGDKNQPSVEQNQRIAKAVKSCLSVF